jgi:hypothetical protein
MSPRIRIADGLLTQSAERLIITAGAIIKGMTGNPSFPSPPVDLNTVQAVTRLINPGINFHSAHSSARRKARKIPHNPAIKRRIDCGTLVNPFHV